LFLLAKKCRCWSIRFKNVRCRTCIAIRQDVGNWNPVDLKNSRDKQVAVAVRRRPLATHHRHPVFLGPFQ